MTPSFKALTPFIPLLILTIIITHSLSPCPLTCRTPKTHPPPLPHFASYVASLPKAPFIPPPLTYPLSAPDLAPGVSRGSQFPSHPSESQRTPPCHSLHPPPHLQSTPHPTSYPALPSPLRSLESLRLHLHSHPGLTSPPIPNSPAHLTPLPLTPHSSHFALPLAMPASCLSPCPTSARTHEHHLLGLSARLLARPTWSDLIPRTTSTHTPFPLTFLPSPFPTFYVPAPAPPRTLHDLSLHLKGKGGEGVGADRSHPDKRVTEKQAPLKQVQWVCMLSFGTDLPEACKARARWLQSS